MFEKKLKRMAHTIIKTETLAGIDLARVFCWG